MEYVYIGLAVMAVLIILFVILVMMRPASFRIERSISVKTRSQACFDQVNDFHLWPNWSPWEKLDPNLQRTFSGPDKGVGAIYEWLGNKKAGQGKMTIVESKPAETIHIKLEFLKPMKVTNKTEFNFTERDNQTTVNWVMTGESGFFFKAFDLVMNMDKLIGKDFEKGLTAMREHLEKA